MIHTAIKNKRVSYEEFQHMELEENALYELIDGEIVKRSAPSLVHQNTVKKIFRLMDIFVSEKNLGEVFFAPVDVGLYQYHVVQPDLVLKLFLLPLWYGIG